MLTIVNGAGLPHDRVVLDGLGYADDVFGFHLYPNWLPDGNRTQESYSNLVQKRLRGVWKRTFVSSLAQRRQARRLRQVSAIGQRPHGDVNMLRGLDDAARARRRRSARAHTRSDSVGRRLPRSSTGSSPPPQLPREAAGGCRAAAEQPRRTPTRARSPASTPTSASASPANGSLLVKYDDAWIAANLAPYLALAPDRDACARPQR